MRNFYCLPSELAFLAMRYVLGWVTATQYSIGTGSQLHRELENHKHYGQVCPWMTLGIVIRHAGEEASGPRREHVLSFGTKFP